MARPKEKEPKIQQTVMLKPSVVKELEQLADRLGLTKSQFMSNIIESGLDEAKTLEKLGVFKTLKFGQDIIKKFKKELFDGKVSLDRNGRIEIEK